MKTKIKGVPSTPQLRKVDKMKKVKVQVYIWWNNDCEILEISDKKVDEWYELQEVEIDTDYLAREVMKKEFPYGIE